MSLDGVEEVLLKTAAPVGQNPDTGFIYTWYELVAGDIILKGEKDDGTIVNIGTEGPQGVQGVQGIQGNPGTQGVPGPSGPMNVEALVSETATVTLPNSTGFQQVYIHTVTVTADGNLFVDISLAVRPHSAGNDMRFEVDFDGTTLAPSYVEEHKDQNNAESMWRSQCLDLGFKVAGTYNLELYFSKENSGGTAQLKNYTAKVVRY